MRVSGNRRSRGGRPNSGNNRSGSNGGRNSGNNRRSNNGNRSYDSNGPDGKIRGSATQVYDKYTTLGRDTQTAGDPVAAENYFQHAEHYYRIMLANNLVKLDKSPDSQDGQDNQDGQDDQDNQSSNGDVENRSNKNSNRNDAVEDLSETSGDDTSSGDDDASATEAAAAEKEPIIINLGEPDAADVKTIDIQDKSDGDEGNDADASGEGDDKPKTKRRVSRTRGLRRRTSRRRTDEEGESSDEPQSA